MASSDPPSGPDGERDVFGSLPNTRPQRRSAKRDRTGGPAKASAAPARAKSAKPRSAKPAAASPGATTPKARAKPRTTASAKPAAGPRAGAATPPIPPSGYATPRADDGVPRGADLVTTAVQAAGELAHIGLSAGGRALKSALGRLPRP